jgi:AcrR family transcriptional regulator
MTLLNSEGQGKMDGPPRRRYDSSNRQRKAEANRTEILTAARRLMIDNGYAGMTMAGIAQAAGVSPQTVYAVFGSKRAILAEIVDQAAYGVDHEQRTDKLRAAQDTATRLRRVVELTRHHHEARRAEIELMRGAGVVSPELAEAERTVGKRRFDNTAKLIDFLGTRGDLRSDLDGAEAHDLLWSLTGPDLYRLLVAERGWSAEQYETRLYDLLARTLLRADATKAAQPPPGE